MITKVHHSCGSPLVYKMEISVEVFASFVLLEEFIKIYKYEPLAWKNTNSLVPVTSNLVAYCRACSRLVEYRDFHFRCDDCDKYFPLKTLNTLGKATNLCGVCYNGQAKYSDIQTIFSEKSKAEIREMIKLFERGPLEAQPLEVIRQRNIAGDPLEALLRNNLPNFPVEENNLPDENEDNLLNEEDDN